VIALAQKPGDAKRHLMKHDDRGIRVKLNAVLAEALVEKPFPDATLQQVRAALKELAPVGGIIARDVRRLALRNRTHTGMVLA
jgi:hypothetical protein